MSRSQRLGLVAAAVVVAVVAFVIVNPGGDDNGDESGTDVAQTTTAGSRGGGSGGSAGQPHVARIEIAGNEVKAGPRKINMKKGDAVRIVVSADKPNSIHLHGYEIEKEATPGKPATFAFTADAEGIFEIESHTFEDAGLQAGIAKLVVEPS